MTEALLHRGLHSLIQYISMSCWTYTLLAKCSQNLNTTKHGTLVPCPPLHGYELVLIITITSPGSSLGNVNRLGDMEHLTATRTRELSATILALGRNSSETYGDTTRVFYFLVDQRHLREKGFSLINPSGTRSTFSIHKTNTKLKIWFRKGSFNWNLLCTLRINRCDVPYSCSTESAKKSTRLHDKDPKMMMP